MGKLQKMRSFTLRSRRCGKRTLTFSMDHSVQNPNRFRKKASHVFRIRTGCVQNPNGMCSESEQVQEHPVQFPNATCSEIDTNIRLQDKTRLQILLRLQQKKPAFLLCKIPLLRWIFL